MAKRLSLSLVSICWFCVVVLLHCVRASLDIELELARPQTGRALDILDCANYTSEKECENDEQLACQWKSKECTGVCFGASRSACLDKYRDHCCWDTTASDQPCRAKKKTNGCGLVESSLKCSVLSKKECKRIWKSEKSCYWYKYAGCRTPCHFVSEDTCLLHSNEECEWLPSGQDGSENTSNCALRNSNHNSKVPTTSSPTTSSSTNHPSKQPIGMEVKPTSSPTSPTPPLEFTDMIVHLIGDVSILDSITSEKDILIDTFSIVFGDFRMNQNAKKIDIIIEECGFSVSSESTLCNRFSYFINRNQYQIANKSNKRIPEALLALRLVGVQFEDVNKLHKVFEHSYSILLSNYSLTLNDMHIVINYGNNDGNDKEMDKPMLERKKPNILMLLADDLGYGDVGYQACNYDDIPSDSDERLCSPASLTPNIDSMSAGDHSAVFKRFFVTPTCGPSRSSILSGREPIRECMLNNIFRDVSGVPPISPMNCVMNVAEMAKLAGHRTFHSGKWHVGKLHKVDSKGNPTPNEPDYVISHPGMNGFDHWVSTPRHAPTLNLNCGCFPEDNKCDMGIYNSSFFWDHYSLNNGKERKYMDKNDPKLFSCDNYWEGNSMGVPPYDPSKKGFGGWHEPLQIDDSKFIVERFVDFIEEDKTNNYETPFFAALWFHAPHGPFISPPEYRNAARALVESLPNPADCGVIFDTSVRFSDAETCMDTLKNKSLCEVICKDTKMHYYGSIMALDEQIGFLRQYLKEKKLYESTVIIFSSDNGPARYDANELAKYIGPGSASHLDEWKFSIMEGGTRVPMIFECSGLITSNKIIKTPATNVDFLPTLLELLNVPYPEAAHAHLLDGISLLPFITGVAVTRRKPIAIVNVDRDVHFILNSSSVVKMYKKSTELYIYDETLDKFVESKKPTDEDDQIGFHFENWFDLIFDPSPCNKPSSNDGIDPEICIDESMSEYF
mmetsp:Transcript_6911/g.9030  ORF Transcript_6911/g.9030 Transcript_6911/m.9030 type:complete len:957 (+) Transcript_6911:20-2890(+)